MTRIEIPTLRTTRLVLRALRADDLDGLAAMQADPEVMRYLGAGATRTRQETWDGIARMLGQWALRGFGMFAIEEAATGRFAGRAGVLYPLPWPEPELAYGLDRPFWGQGLVTEAGIAIRDWAFATLGLPKLASFILPDNAASAAVARKLGAVRTGTITLLGLEAERWEHRPDGARGAAAS
ncbi:GNAT family N-acetyltransferase [Limobrevibacterium gyesilva]|uniref:GNAT family N-acetyltransferase n=1 Tax=Limobrevibacterium gyesilva TaxID=2991712 RepID=A0AA41YS44_9PROT|nr:GNAT family N-acetyltransferase [Limobrevibacterium gyesilva]MCW3477328.1 GNAT family N-acetyltransferase [Limobrevibacterium gyesilva]